MSEYRETLGRVRDETADLAHIMRVVTKTADELPQEPNGLVRGLQHKALGSNLEYAAGMLEDITVALAKLRNLHQKEETL